MSFFVYEHSLERKLFLFNRRITFSTSVGSSSIGTKSVVLIIKSSGLEI